MEINSKDGTCKDKEGERFYPTIYWKPLEEYKDSFSSIVTWITKNDLLDNAFSNKIWRI